MMIAEKPGRQSPRVTERIYATAFEFLEKHPEGLRWSELLSLIRASDPAFHPKTVNGCIWKLPGKFPGSVYKPSKGLFRLKKYEGTSEQELYRNARTHRDTMTVLPGAPGSPRESTGQEDRPRRFPRDRASGS